MKLPVDYNKLPKAKVRIVREAYIKRQKGLCAHCGKPLTGKPSEEVLALEINKDLFPKFFFNYPIHLHHDHDTGMTIGAIHNTCNAVLWQYHGE